MIHTWSEDLDTKLTQLVEDEFTQSEISAIMDIPEHKVKKRIYLLGIYREAPVNDAAIRAATQRFVQDGQALFSRRAA